MTHLLISILVVQLAILWALRPLVWWYLGINRMVRALENIDVSLRTLPTVRDYDDYFERKPPRAA